MDKTYQKFLRAGIDLSSVGVERRTYNEPYDNFQFVASLWTASAVLCFCIAWLYSLFSDGLVDINLYSLVFRGKEFVKGTMLPAQRISPQPAGTFVT